LKADDEAGELSWRTLAAPLPPSWPGFVPAIHVLAASEKQDVDARDERGHDES